MKLQDADALIEIDVKIDFLQRQFADALRAALPIGSEVHYRRGYHANGDPAIQYGRVIGHPGRFQRNRIQVRNLATGKTYFISIHDVRVGRLAVTEDFWGERMSRRAIEAGREETA